jgi:SAM-dependent methyltransferase
MTSKSLNDWHNRFQLQANWTSDLRANLFQRANLRPGNLILDVGCGTGVILNELGERGLIPNGLDINLAHLRAPSHKHTKTGGLTQGDAHCLPYPDEIFDTSLCHFVFMWVADPFRVLAEMVRVTKTGGKVMALAEPDYGGRIDHPGALSILGEWQRESLIHQGANPHMGQQLTGLFHQAGLSEVETGVLGGQWSGPPDWSAWESEWLVLESDMAKNPNPSRARVISELKMFDKLAYENGERVLFVPTFYAWGTVGISQA